MRRNFLKSMLIAGILTLCGAGSLMAADNKAANAEAEKLESQLFIIADEGTVSDNAKLANFLSSDKDPQAKCWFSRNCCYYYPYSYYYYDWYCSWYYVPFQIVYYTVPVQPVVTVTPAVTTTTVSNVVTTPAAVTTTASVTETTETVASTETMIIAKSSQQVARGAVIDKKVPTNSPLYKMGLRAGDVIAKIDGKPVNSMVDVRRMTSKSKVVFIRGNQIKVASKQLLTKTDKKISKSSNGINANEINLDVLKKVQGKEMSLYEYYDSMEK